MTAVPAPARAPGWAATLAAAAGALLLFLLLPQRSLPGMDADYFVVWLEEGQRSYPRHVAYLWICGLLYDLLAPWSLSAYGALRLASALGAAAGLLCLLRAFARLVPGAAWPAAAAVLLTPAWFFYATCGEIPGVFAAGAGLSWLLFARWQERPTPARAALLGLACALAGALHSFGYLLAPTFVAIALVVQRPPVRSRPPRDWLLQGALAAAALLAAALLAALLLGSGAGDQAQDAAHHLRQRWETFAPGRAPAVLWREWLVPYLPWSLLALLALGPARARRAALAVLAAVLLHLPLSVLLLGHHDIREFGAYFIGVAPAAVLAARHLLAGRAFAVALAAGAALSLGAAAPNWPAPVSPGYAAGVAELRAEGPFLLVVANRQELDGARTAAAGMLCVTLDRALGEYLGHAGRGVGMGPWFDGWFQGLQHRGTPVLFSQDARSALEHHRDPAVRAFWREHVAVRYRLEAERRQGFLGTWVRAR